MKASDVWSIDPVMVAATATSGEAATPRLGRRNLWIALTLTLLISIGLSLRLKLAWERNHETPDDLATRLVGDETNYDRLAGALLEGSFFQWPGRVPVYPLFIAAIYYPLGERSPGKLLYIQAIVGALVVPLTYLLARRLTGIIPALIAAGIVAVDDPLVEQARNIYAESLYTPLLLVVLRLLLWALQAPKLTHFAWAGAGMAVLTLCRPTTALFPLFLPLLLRCDCRFTHKIRACTVYCLAMVSVIGPWTYHNWRTYHRFLPLSVSAGVLWQGSPEFYRLVQRQRHHLDIWDNELNPQRNGGHDPFSIDGDRYFNARGLQSIFAEPAVYIEYSLKKGGYLWLGNPAAEWGYLALYDWRTMRQWYPYSSLKLFSMFMARQLPLVALAALVFLSLRGRAGPLLPFIAVCTYFTLIHMLTWAEMRYSEPLHPLLAIIVVMAGAELFGRVAGKTTR